MAALQAGEVDWWEFAISDLLPVLERNARVKLQILDPTGFCAFLRPNHLFPPFDNPAVRRALLGAIDQAEFMAAMVGTDPSLSRVPCGFFPPMSPLASDAGMAALTGRRDYGEVEKRLWAAGYKGEKIALMVPTDFPTLKAASDVAAHALKRAGMDVEYQATDWGTTVQRRATKKPPDQGGWNLFCTSVTGSDAFNPALNVQLRGQGALAWFGWPSSPAIEALRERWLDASDLAKQRQLAADIQAQAFEDVPYYPLGLYYRKTAYRSDLTGMLNGIPAFWSVRRA